jgi:3-deoxy-7-phosphoheptulonate synthase
MSENTRVNKIEPLIKPSFLKNILPISKKTESFIISTRNEIKQILEKKDDRLIVVVGPCSIHDEASALEYANRLSVINRTLKNELLIIMRTYFEKPRTCMGWKGLISDPYLNGTCDMLAGLKKSRNLLVEICENYNLPVSTEFLDPISPQYLSDLIAWGAIGARTVESQVHRQLASGLSCPIGFKNGTSGNTTVAIQACKASSQPHTFFGVTNDGEASIVHTDGNKDCHVILRGGENGPNYFKDQVNKCIDEHTIVKYPCRIMIDCSHGNSRKDHRNQHLVVNEIIKQLRESCTARRSIVGLMLESNLYPGKQTLDPEHPENLKYGVSITDACISWDETVRLLFKLSNAIKNQRKQN